MRYSDELERYPLAEAYGWKADKTTTGGILYIYPPLASYECKGNGEEPVVHQRLSRVAMEAIHPEDLTGAAQRTASVRYYKRRSYRG